MSNTFFTWDNFIAHFAREMACAEEVYGRMVESGRKENCISSLDFDFCSDSKEKLEALALALDCSHGYMCRRIEVADNGVWTLRGETYPLPVSAEKLMYWALDMLRCGVDHDASFEGYGSECPMEQTFPGIEKADEERYFQKGLDCYNQGDRSGAFIQWTNTLAVNPKNANAYYSRAIVRNEMLTWKSAIRDYDEAIRLVPNFLSALINRGSIKDENGDSDGAITDYNRVIANEKADIEQLQMAYFNRGNSRQKQGDLQAALLDWHLALQHGATYAKEKIEQFHN